MKTTRLIYHCFAIATFAAAAHLFGEPLYVPNASFEQPSVSYEEIADPLMISWGVTETQEQAEYGEIGVFVNNPAYTNDVPDDYINNCNGTQAAYMFSDYGLSIYQDYPAVDSTGAVSRGFNAKFEAGHTYKLVTGLIASTNFGQEPGVILQMSFYYRDSSSNMVTIASTNIVYDSAVFTSITNFVDCELDLPLVNSNDAWAGKHIGIQYSSVIPDDVYPGGYWDMDNVRVSSSIYIPNYSFELPSVEPEEIALPFINSWGAMETPTQEAEYELGVFYNNTAYTNDSPDDYIYNTDGVQVAYIFSDQGLGIFQDYDTVDYTGTQSTNFTASFRPGKSYELVTGMIANTNFGQEPGVVMQMSLYYRDPASNIVTIVSTNIPYDTNVFTGITNLVDCSLTMPSVKPTDPWAGQHVGIEFLSVIPNGVSAGGYWDLDNVRLNESLLPFITGSSISNGVFSATVASDPGAAFEVLTSTNISTPLQYWSNLLTVTNATGSTPLVDTNATNRAQFYSTVPLP